MATTTSRAYRPVDKGRLYACEADKRSSGARLADSPSYWCAKRAAWTLEGGYRAYAMWCICEDHHRSLGLPEVPNDYNK